jgi:hypothetical protein
MALSAPRTLVYRLRCSRKSGRTHCMGPASKLSHRARAGPIAATAHRPSSASSEPDAAMRDSAPFERNQRGRRNPARMSPRSQGVR